MTFLAAGSTTRFTTPIANGKVRINRAIPAAQARAASGTLTLTYAGDADTQPYTVQLLAARRGASLKAKRPTIVKGRLKATGQRDQARARLDPGGAALPARRRDAGARRDVHGADRQGPLHASTSACPTALLRDMASSPSAVGSYVLFAGDKRNAHRRPIRLLRAPRRRPSLSGCGDDAGGFEPDPAQQPAPAAMSSRGDDGRKGHD